MSRGTDCVAHHHTALVAQERHHLQPLSRGGQTVPFNMRLLCANAHSDTHYLLDLIEDHAVPMIGKVADLHAPYKAIPYATRRTYGPNIRDAALTGWERYGRRFLEGEFVAHHLLWSTSGQPSSRDDVTPGVPPYAIAEQHNTVESWITAVHWAFNR